MPLRLLAEHEAHVTPTTLTSPSFCHEKELLALFTMIYLS